MAYDLSKLVNLKTLPDGWQCQCVQCAREGKDLKGRNHLKIYRSGAFNCCVDSSSEHNRAIKAILKGDGSEPDIEYIEQAPKLEVEKIYPDSVLDKLIPDYSYWIKRGIRADIVKSLECGIAPPDETGPMSGRSIFPLRNLDGKIVAFTGRVVIENSIAKKWMHFRPVSRALWPWKVSGPIIERTKTAVLLESPGDTLSCLSYDIKPVLCIFGLNMPSLMIATLVASGVNRVFISLNRDSDPRKGQAAADKIARKLAPFISDIQVRLPKVNKDWGEAILTKEGRADLDAFKQEIES